MKRHKKQNDLKISFEILEMFKPFCFYASSFLGYEPMRQPLYIYGIVHKVHKNKRDKLSSYTNKKLKTQHQSTVNLHKMTHL